MFADYSREFGTIHELAPDYSFGVRFGVREMKPLFQLLSLVDLKLLSAAVPS
jgi:hypothetical protein